MNVETYIGVDVGSLRDFTAISVVRKRFVTPDAWQENMYREDGPTGRARYELLYLNQLPIGVNYPAIVDELHRVSNRPELPHASLILDATGVGKPVVDMLRDRGLNPIGVTITGGHNVSNSAVGYSVPKRDLVSSLQVALHTGALRIAGSLQLASALQNQLSQFNAKPTRGGGETYEAVRESVHDDLVLSVALAVWYAQAMGGRLEMSDSYFVEDYEPL